MCALPAQYEPIRAIINSLGAMVQPPLATHTSDPKKEKKHPTHTKHSAHPSRPPRGATPAG